MKGMDFEEKEKLEKLKNGDRLCILWKLERLDKNLVELRLLLAPNLVNRIAMKVFQNFVEKWLEI